MIYSVDKTDWDVSLCSSLLRLQTKSIRRSKDKLRHAGAMQTKWVCKRRYFTHKYMASCWKSTPCVFRASLKTACCSPSTPRCYKNMDSWINYRTHHAQISTLSLNSFQKYCQMATLENDLRYLLPVHSEQLQQEGCTCLREKQPAQDYRIPNIMKRPQKFLNLYWRLSKWVILHACFQPPPFQSKIEPVVKNK